MLARSGSNQGRDAATRRLVDVGTKLLKQKSHYVYVPFAGCEV
jgi:hypothetical protein